MSENTRVRHVLAGIRPEPLASYLTGLGLFRLLGEQADQAATSRWESGALVIETAVQDVADWLASAYVPTPVLSPWNNGSGFGAKDVEPKKTLAALRANPMPRLAPFQAAIGAAALVAESQEAKGWEKPRTVQEFRNRCPDEALAWIDASVVLADDQTYFPPLLGTGGNDGRFDFSTNFHQRLLDVLGTSEEAHFRSLTLARDLLGGKETEPLANAAVGQFDPAAAGGPGSSRFGAAASLVNSWAFVLLIEGALLFAASASRRYQHGAGRAAMPFTVYASPDGSASGADGEETRGEIWVPVWTRPYTLAEVRQLFGEARASWNGHPARRSVDFYAATRTLGVARGIDEFIRYGLQRRNGLAFAAVPLDRVDVRANPAVGLLAQVQDWATRAASADQSAAVTQAARQFDKAQMAYARNGEPDQLRNVLAALTSLEQAVGRSGRARDKISVRRPPRAGSFLVELAREGATPEFRIAVGLASSAAMSAAGPARTMRQILLPVDPPDAAERARSAGRWRDSPVVPGLGVRALTQVMADVLAWRLRTAADEPGQEKFSGAPTFRLGIPVPVADLHAWALDQLDDPAIETWLRACLALDWGGIRHEWRPVGRPLILVATLGLLHPLARGLASADGDDGVRLALRPDWANRLAAGQVRSVHEEAVVRLRQIGWQAVPALTYSESGAQVAAALVPRATGWHAALLRLATPLRTTPENTPSADRHDSADLDAGEFTESPEVPDNNLESPELTEELS